MELSSLDSPIGVKGGQQLHLFMEKGSVFLFYLFLTLKSPRSQYFNSKSWYLWKALDKWRCIQMLQLQILVSLENFG